jgi:hypothetical protein
MIFKPGRISSQYLEAEADMIHCIDRQSRMGRNIRSKHHHQEEHKCISRVQPKAELSSPFAAMGWWLER